MSVTAENTLTGVVTTTITNEAGVYTFPTLQTGRYRLKAELTGFQTKTYTDVTLEVGAQLRLNFELAIAATANSVNVSAVSEVPLAQLSSTIAGVLSLQRVSDLPLADRNAASLASTQAGVNGTSFDGNSNLFTATKRDGVDINGTRGNGVDIYTSVDLVEEVRVVTTPADAEIARGSGQIQLSTRSGTNAYHGSLFWSIRNTAMNANTWARNFAGSPRDILNRNQFGGRVGGPIVKNKTFFFYLYDGQRQVATSEQNTTTLTATARQGLFRFYPGVQNGNASTNNPTVDLLGNPVSPAGATGPLQTVSVFGRDPARLSADTSGLISKLMAINPLPNDFRSGDGLNTAAIKWNRKSETNRNQHNVRVDQNFSQSNRLSVSLTVEDNWGGLYAASSLPNIPSGYSRQDNNFISGNLTSTLNSRTVNQFTMAVLDPINDRDSRYDQQTFSLNGVYKKFEPKVNVNKTFDPNGPIPFLMGTTSLAFPIGNQSPIWDQGTYWTFGDTLSIASGRHQFKMGFDFRTGNSNDTDSGGNGANVIPRVILGAGGVAVSNISGNSGIPNIGSNGTAAQNMLIDLSGSVSSVVQLLNVNQSQNPVFEAGQRRIRDIHQREASGFFKDDFKIGENVQLNLGVRWDWYGVPWDKKGLITGLVGGSEGLWGISGKSWDVMYQPGVAQGQLTQEILVGKNSPHPGQKAYNDDYNNFAPAVGFTWSIPYFGKGKTVLRAGYSVSYPRTTTLGTVDTNVSASPGTSAVETRQSASYFDLSMVTLPLLTNVTPLSIVPVTDRAQTQRAYDNNLVSPYIQSFNVSLGRELVKDLSIDVRYVGSKGTKLISTVNLNDVNTFETGILDAFRITQAGGNAPLFDQIFNGLVVNNGQAAVNGTTVTGSAALRQLSTTRAFFAQNNVGGLASYLNTTNSFTGVTGGLLRRVGLPENFIVVNPQYSTANLLTNIGDSFYHSLQLEATKRLSKGWTISSNYTFSKLMGMTGSNIYKERYNRRANRGRLNGDNTHVLKANGTYELPFGPNKMFLGNAPGFVSRLVEGWQFGGIMTFSTGGPQTFSSGTNTVNNGGNNTADLIGALPEGKMTVLTFAQSAAGGITYFPYVKQIADPIISSFTTLQGVAGQSTLKAITDSNGNVILQNPSIGRFGYSGQVMNGLSSIRLDMNLVKRITISEGKTFELRIDAIDALNHPNFGNPNMDINSTSFGRITSASGSRVVVGNLRLNF